MPAPDLPLLIEAAREAGRIANRFFEGEAQRWEKPDGLGPVTEADLAVNAWLERFLRAERPDYGWLSEESEDTPERLGRNHVFIIDPLDGTRSFMEGARTWAHSIAVADRGRVTAAVIYLPRMDLLYRAAEGEGAFLNRDPITASHCTRMDGADVLAARPAMEPRHWAGPVPGFKRSYRPSLAYRLALVAQGRFDAMLTLRPSWEWDIAAGDLILREAGAACTDRTGQPILFNNPDPRIDGVVAAGPDLHRQMVGALRPADPAAS